MGKLSYRHIRDIVEDMVHLSFGCSLVLLILMLNVFIFVLIMKAFYE